jgi:hypothetical protein
MTIPHSRLMALHRSRFERWADVLESHPGHLIAISRKGPRLLELMTKEGILPSAVLDRVSSEIALPLISPGARGDLVVIDDAVTHGSTFARVINAGQRLLDACGGNGKVIGIPFAVNKAAPAEARALAASHFLPLEPHECAQFVENQVEAFRLLSKPFDVEHPIRSLRGYFQNADVVGAIVEEVARAFEGESITLHRTVPTQGAAITVYRWAILLPRSLGLDAQPNRFAKIRIYLEPDLSALTLALMQPRPLDLQQPHVIATALPESLAAVWDAINVKCDRTNAYPGASRTCERTLAATANFLLTSSGTDEVATKFADASRRFGIDTTLDPLSEFDTRLLFGSQLGEEVRAAAAVMPADTRPAVSLPGWVSPGEGTAVPAAFRQQYERLVGELVRRSTDVDDVVRALFHAQHIAIEVPSRAEASDPDSRLDFGVTFDTVKDYVRQAVPEAPDWAIHRAFDRLIDDGAVVPRYIQVESASGKVWTRFFRVGEGVVEKCAHLLRLLFESLHSALNGSKDIPAELLEKFCALTIFASPDDADIGPLRLPELEKGFALYGSRCMIETGIRKQFLISWALDGGLLLRSDGDQVNDGGYALSKDLDRLYPRSESPWDDRVRDAVEDLAHLTAAIHHTERLRDRALVAVTSVATEAELQKAVVAELHLWLRDPRYSINRSLAACAAIAEELSAGTASVEALRQVNQLLSATANTAAQARFKVKLAGERRDIFDRITEVAAQAKYTERRWREVRKSLESRVVDEGNPPGLRETKAAVILAHRVTSVLRDWLNDAGFRDPTSKRTLRSASESLRMLRELITTSTEIDDATRAMLAAQHGRLALADRLDAIIAETHVPQTLFGDLRPVLLDFIARIDQVVTAHGTGQPSSAAKILEPPQYIVMWDLRGSTNVHSRDELEGLVADGCRRIEETLRDRAMNFHSESKEDGNGLVCRTFRDVRAVFQVLCEVYRGHLFRAGCEVNVQGRLNYYPDTKSLGGRAFEHAARIAALFKEIRDSPKRWIDGALPTEPPTSYLVVGEFAARYAAQEGSWPVQRGLVQVAEGLYSARVSGCLPISVSILVEDTTER